MRRRDQSTPGAIAYKRGKVKLCFRGCASSLTSPTKAATMPEPLGPWSNFRLETMGRMLARVRAFAAFVTALAALPALAQQDILATLNQRPPYLDPANRFQQFSNRHGMGTALKIFLMIASVVTACASAS